MGARVADLLRETFTEVDGGALIAYMQCSGYIITEKECLAARRGRRTVVDDFFRPRGYLTADHIDALYKLLTELPTYSHYMARFRAVVREDFRICLS